MQLIGDTLLCGIQNPNTKENFYHAIDVTTGIERWKIVRKAPHNCSTWTANNILVPTESLVHILETVDARKGDFQFTFLSFTPDEFSLPEKK